jgi:uncharacterized protein with HEPN domain
MYKSYIPYLQHIYDECLYIRSVVTDDMQIEQFLRDETLKRAVTRSLTIIGEATKKIPADVKYAWRSISWREMAGMRDKLVHDYMGVNYYIVWDVAKNIIPTLTTQINEVISSHQADEM